MYFKIIWYTPPSNNNLSNPSTYKSISSSQERYQELKKDFKGFSKEFGDTEVSVRRICEYDAYTVFSEWVVAAIGNDEDGVAVVLEKLVEDSYE